MTWPPRTILAVSLVAALLVLLGVTVVVPWYRRLPISPGGRRLVATGVVVFLLLLIAGIVFIVPTYWD